MAEQNVAKKFTRALIDLEEMTITEHTKDGDVAGTFSLQELLEDIADGGMVEFGVTYKSSIPSEEE